MPLRIIVPTVTLELKPKEITKAIRGAGRLLATTVRNLIETSSGEPGQPPKMRTGKLASSIRSSARRGYVKVVADTAGATALEVGAIGGGGVKGTKSMSGVKGKGRTKRGKPATTRKMAPRPYMEPALKAKEPEITRRLEQAIMHDLDFRVTK